MNPTLPGMLFAWLDFLHLAPVVAVLAAAFGFSVAASRGWPPVDRLGPFLLALTLTQLAISIHNDYCDRELDATAKPWRVLPRGAISPKTALALAVVLLVLGLLAAGVLGPVVLVLVAVGTGAGLVYNAGLKRTVWSWLPFWVALPTLPVCAVAAIGGTVPPLWPVYLIGGPLVVGIYLADTLEDIEADSALGVHGLAHRLGARFAPFACWGAIALAQLLALILWPASRQPGPLFFLSVGLLGAAIGFGVLRAPQAHWPAVFASAIALAVAWFADYAVGAGGG